MRKVRVCWKNMRNPNKHCHQLIKSGCIKTYKMGGINSPLKLLQSSWHSAPPPSARPAVQQVQWHLISSKLPMLLSFFLFGVTVSTEAGVIAHSQRLSLR